MSLQIAELRKNEKMSQLELAKKLGVSRPTLVALEKGEKDITLFQLEKLSDIFDIPLEILLDEGVSAQEKIQRQGSSQNFFKKFHNLVLQCIKYGADSDGRITKTKLAKLVYLCDFAHYYRHLDPISGFEYKKLPQGPVAIEFFDLIDNDESIFVEQRGKAILVSLIEKPDDNILSKTEQEIVQEVCLKWKDANTQEIVEFTHSQIPWSVCRDREVIPYSLINMEEPENVI
jgi:transcriptional regulator with XRE-family HTH domain